MREERELILALDVPRELKADLLAVATMVGSRHFAREVLEAVFREEMEMIKEGSLFSEWLDEALEQGRQQGRQQGRSEGEAQGVRQITLRLLRERFGEIPAAVVARVEAMSPAACEQLATRLLKVSSLAELGLTESANGQTGPAL